MKVGSISSSYIFKPGHRFEGEYYLNDNSYNSMIVENIPNQTTLEKIANVFNPGIFKRQFCKNTGNAVEYFQSSDVPNSSEKSQVYVNKKQAESLNLTVKRNDILVTGFGTIGNTRLVTKHQDNVCYANNVCRIRANDEQHVGFLYAFMSSKYGNAQLNKNASGSVVRYIESPGIRRTIIPDLPIDFQTKIDILIKESTARRESSTEALTDAIKAIKEYVNYSFIEHPFKCERVSSQDILNSLRLRIDPPSIMNDGVTAMKDVISKLPYKLIADLDVTVRRPGIFKRIKVENGIPYIKGSEIFFANPFKRCEHLSKSRTPFIDEMALKEGQILVTCAGSVGDVKMITKEYEDKSAIGSQDIIRIDSPAEDDFNTDNLFCKEYLFAYLQLPFVYSYMQSMKYGSVIERIEPFHVESIPVVEPTPELSVKVKNLIRSYMDDSYKAFCLEEEAITLVEKEIEKWNN